MKMKLESILMKYGYSFYNYLTMESKKTVNSMAEALKTVQELNNSQDDHVYYCHINTKIVSDSEQFEVFTKTKVRVRSLDEI